MNVRVIGKVVLNSHEGVEDSSLMFNHVTGCRSVVSLKRWPFEPLKRTAVPTGYTSWPVCRFRGEKPRTAGGGTICGEIHKLITSIWKREKLPEEWKESIIVPIHKKGDKTDCNNYRGISLLPTAYKILSNILLSR